MFCTIYKVSYSSLLKSKNSCCHHVHDTFVWLFINLIGSHILSSGMVHAGCVLPSRTWIHDFSSLYDGMHVWRAWVLMYTLIRRRGQITAPPTGIKLLTQLLLVLSPILLPNKVSIAWCWKEQLKYNYITPPPPPSSSPSPLPCLGHKIKGWNQNLFISTQSSFYTFLTDMVH